MKTPMQELIEWIDMSLDNCDLVDMKNLKEPLEATKVQAERLLKEEKQCIIDAHEAGFFREGHEPVVRSDNELTKEAEQYYTDLTNQ